jgi:CRISPR-associated protein Cmr2
MKHATGQTFKLPPDLSLDSWPPACLNEDWVALEIRFELLTPWYSRDDRILHVLDNPVRKEWVFGVPFMAASSWKGLLRWACRMRSGLLEHLEKEKPFKDWHDPDWIIHLFGHEKAQEAPENLRQGALVFYPTWFDRIGFEVINPHSRARRAGTKPIYYEVVPPGAKGTLLLLYAPLPGMARRDGVQYEKVLQEFLEALKDLLTTYGISAKRTVGWGTAKIETWRADRKNRDPIVENALEQFVDRLIATYSR